MVMGKKNEETRRMNGRSLSFKQQCACLVIKLRIATNSRHKLIPLDEMATVSLFFFRFIFVNEKFCILITIALKFVPSGPIDNYPTLIKIMTWRRIGDKPLSEPMLTQFTEHICGNRGRWANRAILNWKLTHRLRMRYDYLTTVVSVPCT